MGLRVIPCDDCRRSAAAEAVDLTEPGQPGPKPLPRSLVHMPRIWGIL